MTEVRKSGFLRAIALLIILLTLSSERGQAQDGRPVADAGSSRYAGPDPVVLDGTGSYDPDNSGTLSYTWRQISGPSVFIFDENTATPTIAGSMVPGAGRDPTPNPGGFLQTSEIQECEFELIVYDGDYESLPDTVRVVIVPDFGESVLRLENDSFDPNKPTFIFFGGGNCETGHTGQYIDLPDWISRANIINFPNGYEPDPGGSTRTYYRYGDMILVYLSSVAPDYKQLIQTSGWSTGGQPAVDVGIHLNLNYQDARYAVNHVTFFDATGYCRDYSQSISTFLNSSVDGEQCWIDNYVSTTGNQPNFHPNILNMKTETSAHPLAPSWYFSSFSGDDMNQFNNGVIAGAYWSIIGAGKNLQLASTPGVEAYKFTWYGDESTGYMDFYDEVLYPGRLPEPVTLIGPEDGAIVDANGALLSCEESENAVGYQLLFGSEPYRVMDYMIVSDTHNPPSEVVTSFPYEQTWWTVRAYDAFGSTIHADPCYINVAFPANAKYSGGAGEPNDPYQIDTADDLMLLGDSPEDYGKHFIMIDDIDLDPNLPGRKVFERAVIAPDVNSVEDGFQGTTFAGVFDGNGHTIRHLTIIGESYIGLFGHMGFSWDRFPTAGKIRNLSIVDANITGSGDYVGGLVGENYYGNVTNCYGTGMIRGNAGVGGLAGFNQGFLSDCHSTCVVNGNYDVGGLVGWNTSNVTNSYSTGMVRGETGVGGLAGRTDGDVTNSYSTATVSGENCVGGLVGVSYSTTDPLILPDPPIFIPIPVNDFYSTRSVGVEEKTNGLVGTRNNLRNNEIRVRGSFVINSYSSGTVRGKSNVGGLVGASYGPSGFISDSWWDSPSPVPVQLTNCYSTALVSGEEKVGGLVGYNHMYGSDIIHCYSTGTVNGSNAVGGLIGSGGGDVTACFWDIETSGQAESAGGEGKTTAEMQTAGTFLDAGWDFMGDTANGTEDIWWIDEGQGYPRLWWQYGLAFSPYPQDGAIDVIQPVILNWLPGGSGLYHDVYFSEDEEAVANATTESLGIYRGRLPVEVTTYEPGVLELDKTYYWRIDEVDEDNANSPWNGNVWSFMTADFIVVDDFESYNDINIGEPGSRRIYVIWVDGWDNPSTNGSVVDSSSVKAHPLLWVSIVHFGRGSICIFYNNSGPATNSEAKANVDNLAIGRDWTIEGVEILSLWLYGDQANDPEPIYVALANDNGLIAPVYHNNPDATQIEEWTQWKINLQEFADQGLDLTNINTITIGFGNRNNLVAGGRGEMFFDDIRLYRPPEPEPEL